MQAVEAKMTATGNPVANFAFSAAFLAWPEGFDGWFLGLKLNAMTGF